MKGGDGFLRRSPWSTALTTNGRGPSSATMARVSASVDGTSFSPSFSRSVATNSGARRRPGGVEAPVLLGTKAPISCSRSQIRRTGDRLDAPRRQTAADLLPEERADLVADQAVEHAPRLLGVRFWSMRPGS